MRMCTDVVAVADAARWRRRRLGSVWTRSPATQCLFGRRRSRHRRIRHTDVVRYYVPEGGTLFFWKAGIPFADSTFFDPFQPSVGRVVG